MEGHGRCRSRIGYGEGFDYPLDWRTAEVKPDVWNRWLARDPVRKVGTRLDAMRKMAAVFLDAGVNDEHNLQLGMRQLSAKLAAAGIAHVHEEFDGGHAGTPWRYERSFETITRVLADR